MIPALANELIDGFEARGECDLFTRVRRPDERPLAPVHARARRGAVGGPPALEPGPDARARELRGRSREAGAGGRGERVALRGDRTRPGPPRRTSPTAPCSRRCSTTTQDGDRMTREEIVANTKLMLSGGLQEPRDVIALVLHALGSNPEQLEEVRADRSLVKPAVEETLRWAGPVGTSTRQTTETTELAGVKLAGGRADRRGALEREPRPAAVHRSRPVRRPPQGGRAPGVRGREPLLPRGVVRAAPRARLARDPARPPAGSAARPRAPGDAVRMGVPGARTRRGCGGTPCDAARARPRRDRRLAAPAAVAASVRSRRFYAEGHSAVLADERGKDRTDAPRAGGRGDPGRGPAAGRSRARCGQRRRVPAVDVPELVLRRGRGVPHRQRRELPERPG